ncbi:MAG: hypothetical protein GXP13_08950 [Gammaproteobacteria bacterium]|nr:hypothetical protein [Gammaproteobacteria bacterium]
MRDVLGGMEELAIIQSYGSFNNVFEILDITPPTTIKENNKNTLTSQYVSAEIIPLHPYNIACNK